MSDTGTIRRQPVPSETAMPPTRHDIQSTLEKQFRKRTERLAEVNELLRKEIAERKNMEADLQDSHERLRLLSIHLQKIREDERTSLSRELHDEFGQALTGMKLDVGWIKRRLSSAEAPIIERLDSVLEALDHTIDTVQHMSARLRPVVLDDFGLRDAAELAARDLKKRANIVCSVISEPYVISLDEKISTEAFRILQESLTNVMRHSRAKNVSIAIRKRRDVLTLEIHDNGKGITKKELKDPRSLGLTGMQERAHALGGTLSITGIRGKGTTVTLTVPLKRMQVQGKEE
jgi:signal transduction histidine kinase